MAKKKKYYVVWAGHRTGIFESWEECQLATKGFPNAQFKSFESSVEATEAFRGNPSAYIQKKKNSLSDKKYVDKSKIIMKSISVDAACSRNPGIMEYRGVWTHNGDEIFRQGPFDDGTNNIGEFLALVHVLALLKNKKQFDLPVYSDSKIAMGWVKKGKCNSKLEKTNKNAYLFELIERAEKWLAENMISNPILKWETKSWGEIPADFGRK